MLFATLGHSSKTQQALLAPWFLKDLEALCCRQLVLKRTMLSPLMLHPRAKSNFLLYNTPCPLPPKIDKVRLSDSESISDAWKLQVWSSQEFGFSIQNREVETVFQQPIFWELGSVRWSGGLQANLYGRSGGRSPQEKVKLHFAHECRNAIMGASCATHCCIPCW
jgi:hypothetical protein